MTLVVLGIDALDPELVNPTRHENLVLSSHASIETISSASGEPSTHELWPTIITGLRPEVHGLTLADGVAWDSSLLRFASTAANYVLPDPIQSRIGAWLLNSTEQDAFRETADYYETEGLETVFDDRTSRAIGIPNYVVDPSDEDREHKLRKDMGKMFERDAGAKGGHKSNDPLSFYERCLEMSMIRIARTRRALRSRQHELVFGYTSGLDLIGHVSYDAPKLQERAYDELDDFVGELRGDLNDGDTLLLISDHGLQDGVHTHEAMAAGTDPEMVKSINAVVDVKAAVDDILATGRHRPADHHLQRQSGNGDQQAVKEQLEDLGYMN